MVMLMANIIDEHSNLRYPSVPDFQTYEALQPRWLLDWKFSLPASMPMILSGTQNCSVVGLVSFMYLCNGVY